MSAETIVAAEPDDLALRFARALAASADDIPSGALLYEYADSVLRRLQAQDPAGYREWAHKMTVPMAATAIGTVLRSRRSRAPRAAAIERFADALAQPTPELRALGLKLATEGNRWKPLGELTGIDLDFVIAKYEARAAANAIEAARYRTIRARVADDQTVASVFTEDEAAAVMFGGVT